MDWIAPYSLAKSTRLIRKFLIEVASMESQIGIRGLYVTRKIEDFENATLAMDEFPESFSLLKRNIAHIDKETYLLLENLERDALLVEQISLINLKIQMSRRPEYTSILTIFAKTFANIQIFSRPETKRLFGEESISIERTIVSCDKLISTLKIAEGILRHREELDDEIFKPSRIKESMVIELIDKASEEIEQSNSLTQETKKLVNSYLAEIKAEAESKIPKWSNIIGSLMIVAALTSGLADAPGATKTLQTLIEYIVGTSVSKPIQFSLPRTGEENKGETRIISGIKI